MKKLIFLPAFLMISLKGICQFHDTYQPDSVYKANKVKYRILRGKYNKNYNNISSLFNHEGQLIVNYEFDSSGIRPVHKTIYHYDSSKAVSDITAYYYTKFDSVSKTTSFFATPDSSQTLFFTVLKDSANREIEEIGRNKKGQIIVNTKFAYNPLMMIEEYWNSAKTWKSSITYYFDMRWIDNRVTGKEYQNDSVVVEWDDLYKNSFDNLGRVVRRKLTHMDLVNGKRQNTFHFKLSEYKYDKNGLLIEKTFTEPSDHSGAFSALRFDYKYWE